MTPLIKIHLCILFVCAATAAAKCGFQRPEPGCELAGLPCVCGGLLQPKVGVGVMLYVRSYIPMWTTTTKGGCGRDVVRVLKCTYVLDSQNVLDSQKQSSRSTCLINRSSASKLAMYPPLLFFSMVAMVTMGDDLQPGCLADRLLTGSFSLIALFFYYCWLLLLLCFCLLLPLIPS